MRHLRPAAALLCAAPALAQDTGHSHDDAARSRLILADAEAGRVTVTDPAEGTRAAFDLPTPSRLTLGPDERRIRAPSRVAGAVRLIDSGHIAEDHGGHAAVVPQAPALTAAALSGEGPGVTATYAMDRGVIRPMMAVAGDRVAIPDPARGAVVMVDAGDLAVTQRIDIGGAPQSLVLIAAEADHDH